MSTALPEVQPVENFQDVCIEPIKRIFTGDDIAAWLQSEALARLSTVMIRLNCAIRGKRIGQGDAHQSEVVKSIAEMLSQLERWVDEIPLDTRAQRFGNRAFRDWGARLEERSRALHEAWLPESHKALLPELIYYFNNAFGNWTRIDYGSGHELSFLGYLTVLRYTGLLSEEDEQAMVFSLFEKYLNVCRKLQKVYRLEPAGSKGVWGLEDHQFLNYLWGSSQLVGQSEVMPSHILEVQRMDSSTVQGYIFLSSIAHIMTLKRGPFSEHSPILHNIASTVPNWQKVNSGLIKMYQAEVLEKHPVVQHFWFGWILPWNKAGTGEKLPSTGDSRQKEDDAEHDAVEDKQTNWQASTQAPWAMPASAQRQVATAAPVATTAAPWARSAQLPGQISSTAAPWTSQTGALRQNDGGPARFPPTGRPAQPAGRTLASTGSAAAMSSPLGVISQPLTGLPRSQPSRQL